MSIGGNQENTICEKLLYRKFKRDQQNRNEDIYDL